MTTLPLTLTSTERADLTAAAAELRALIAGYRSLPSAGRIRPDLTAARFHRAGVLAAIGAVAATTYATLWEATDPVVRASAGAPDDEAVMGQAYEAAMADCRERPVMRGEAALAIAEAALAGQVETE
jgi:hypothetical protein